MIIVPQIFLYQEQVDTLWREFMRCGVAQQRRALGMELDGGEVYHVYTAPPSAHFAGTPCLAVVDMRGVSPGNEVPPDLGPHDGVRVVVLLGLADGRVRAGGFVYREEQWVEGTVK
ncbi:MAG: hypothetical protein ACRDRS_03690, partial [Pseudonocardiaceae bacterium]